MFGLESTQVYLARAPVDLRKSIDGLSLLVSHVLGQARPGDLVMLLVGSSEFERLWQLLESMRSGQVAQTVSWTVS